MSEAAEKQELAVQQPSTVTGFLQAIEKISTNPGVDPDKLERLLDIQMRAMARQAEMDYNEALSEVQPLLPEIPKTRQGHNSKYAAYEDIMRPYKKILAEHGFSLDFDSEHIEGGIKVIGRLRHKSGHSETRSIPLPADTSGNKNGIQGIGSTMQYGKRYVLGMLLNVVTVGEDDDGDGAGAKKVDDKQLSELCDLVAAWEPTDQQREAMLKHFKVKDLSEIRADRFEYARDMLKRKVDSK